MYPVHTNFRRPRESGDPVAFVTKTLDSRFRGNDELGEFPLFRFSNLRSSSRGFPRRSRMRQLLANDLSHRNKYRLSLDVGNQRIVDQGLVIAASCSFDDPAEMVEDVVVQTNRDLCLAWICWDDRTSFALRKIYIGVGLTLPFAQLASFAGRFPSTQKWGGRPWPPAMNKQRPEGYRRHS